MIGQVLAAFAISLLSAVPGALADSSAANIKNCPDGNWCTYHRDHNGWRYSPLQEINASNVKNLKVAWIFNPGHHHQGIHSTPLAIDGTVYVSTNPSTVWALNGATGERKWAYVPDLYQEVVARSLFAHTRGLAAGDGRIYMGVADGRVIALSERSGNLMWDKRLIDSAKETVGFSGAGSFVSSDLFVIGQNGGEYPIEGKIFGLNPKNGNVKWTFYTTGRGDPKALATWGGESWKWGGGGSWQPGSVDFKHNQIIIGTGNPNPDHDYCGDRCRDPKADGWRPGDNLYTSSTIALDLDTGKLNWYFQEAPSDPYDYDGAPGEKVLLSQGGKDYIFTPGKNGYNHVFDRKTGKPVNVYQDQKTANWTKGYNLKTGEWEGMLWPKPGEKTLVCPAIDGGHSWNAGAYNPDLNLDFRTVQEWCMWLTVQPKSGGTTISAGSESRTLEPFVQAFMSAEWIGTDPPGGKNHGRVVAREPVSGKIAWDNRYDLIPHSSLLSTGGGLVFNGLFDGWLEALDAKTGKQLWKFNNGTSHNGGIISYSANGKQMIAAAVGHGTYVGRAVAGLNKDKLVNYGLESASVVAYQLQ